MMEIMKTAMKEKLRRKELYIIVAIAALFLLMLTSGNSSLSINGKMITEYENIIGVFIVFTHFVCCVLAIVLSISTIENEYERKTSHLVWIRGISQLNYHGQLACANIAISLIAQLVFWVMLAFYCISQGEAGTVLRLIPAYLLCGISIVIVSLFTSVLSIKLPTFVTGLLSVVVMIVGVFHGLLELFTGAVQGIGASLLKWMLYIMPDFNENAQMASKMVLGESISLHSILVGVLTIYIVSWGIYLFRKKEA